MESIYLDHAFLISLSSIGMFSLLTFIVIAIWFLMSYVFWLTMFYVC